MSLPAKPVPAAPAASRKQLDSLRRRRLQIGSLLEPASCLREAPAEPQLPGQLSSQCRGIRTVIVERGAADERGPGVVDHPVEARTPGVVRLRGGDLGEHRHSTTLRGGARPSASSFVVSSCS